MASSVSCLRFFSFLGCVLWCVSCTTFFSSSSSLLFGLAFTLRFCLFFFSTSDFFSSSDESLSSLTLVSFSLPPFSSSWCDFFFFFLDFLLFFRFLGFNFLLLLSSPSDSMLSSTSPTSASESFPLSLCSTSSNGFSFLLFASVFSFSSWPFELLCFFFLLFFFFDFFSFSLLRDSFSSSFPTFSLDSL